MKFFKAGLLSAVIIGLSPASNAYETLPPELDGTMMPYDFEKTDSVLPWEGTNLEPVAISYVARHGARFLSSSNKVKPLAAAVEEARKAGSLTPEGEAFASLLDMVCRLNDGRWGDLSPLGLEEENRLGRGVCADLPNLSRHLAGNALSSYVPRVVKTMWEFLYPLAANDKMNEIATAEGTRFSPLVRFFRTDSIYAAYIKKGNWIPVTEKFIETHVSPEPSRRLFGNLGDDSRMRGLTLEMYGVLQSLRCTGLPAPTTRWMSEAEYRSCWEASNLKRYYTRSRTLLSNDAMTAVSPLLENIIERTDMSLNTDSLNANFWFGHAETLLPLLALMDIPGGAALVEKPEDVRRYWRDYELTPMGANLLIVILKDSEGSEARAAVRLNGRWTEAARGEGLLPTWECLRGQWQRAIDQIGSGAGRR